MALSFVRQDTGNGSSSPLSVTITAASTGTVLVAMIASVYGGAGGRSVSTVACTNTTGWTKIGAAAAANGEVSEMWYGYATGTTGSTVTITFSGSVTTAVANISQWSGSCIPPGLDGVPATQTGNSTSPSSNTFSLLTASSYSPSVVLAMEAHKTGTAPSVNPSGFTPLTFIANSTTVGVQGDYLTGVTSTGSQSAAWTIGSAYWSTIIAALSGASRQTITGVSHINSATVTTSVFDSSAVTDSPNLNVPVNVNVIDSSSITDSPSLNIPVALSVSDSSATTDAVTTNISVSINVFDSTTTTDTTAIYIPVLVSVFDNSAITDSPSLNIPVALSVSDSSTVSESTTIFIPILTITKSDSTAVSDAPTVNIPVASNIFDSITITDSASLSLLSNIIISDLTTVTDTLALSIPINITVSDSTTITDTLALSIPINITVSDSTTITDTPIINTKSGAFAVDSTTVTDNVSLNIPVSLSVSDFTSVSDTPTFFIPVPVLDILVTDSTAVLDVITVNPNAVMFSVSDTIVVTDVTIVKFADQLFISDSTATTDFVQLDIPVVVFLSDTSTVTDQTTPNISVSISLSDKTKVLDAAKIAPKLNPGIAYIKNKLIGGASVSAK